ncbi:hypothetical protein OJF2_62100 [Aquisphaera giovannonii]|uniref:Uncharacterized protein n=1 Tax=Aquisphaera giovannonii TaxID=406548 RepID=A0A5B9WBN5_9BACT|nr:hypothetical protein [Aquisphaera giovannonii]QEH37619.1 hypothetical protein OJF2_62100 [Aquisphaera giovannonii]
MSKATVYIWMPSGKFLKNVVGKGLGVGHAAVELERDNEPIDYITWMAHGSPFKALVPSVAGDAYRHIGQYTLAQDKRGMLGFFGQAEPSYAIELPELRLPSHRGPLQFGVDVACMANFWEDRLRTSPKYAFLSKDMNCTGCVVDALRAGGLDHYLDDPGSWVIQGASSLLTWVRDAGTKLTELNRRQAAVDDYMRNVRMSYHGPQPLQVPRLEDWKRDSDSKVSFRPFASRSEQVAALDAMIKDYPNARDDLTRCVLLVKMQHEIYSHLTTKPNSDRREAVKTLGAQVTASLERLDLDGDELENLDDARRRWIIRTMAWRTDGGPAADPHKPF